MGSQTCRYLTVVCEVVISHKPPFSTSPLHQHHHDGLRLPHASLRLGKRTGSDGIVQRRMTRTISQWIIAVGKADGATPLLRKLFEHKLISATTVPDSEASTNEDRAAHDSNPGILFPGKLRMEVLCIQIRPSRMQAEKRSSELIVYYLHGELRISRG